jgi:hypothetical protein
MIWWQGTATEWRAGRWVAWQRQEDWRGSIDFLNSHRRSDEPVFLVSNLIEARGSKIDATIDASAPALLLVRGDALRATGHEADATEAYAAAAIALGADVVPDPTTPDEDVAVPYGPTDPDPQ